jgi:F-box protein 21
MDDQTQLLQLPDELLSVVTCHIPTAADTAAFGLTCRRVRKIVCTSPVWKKHCLTTWKYWEPRHQLPAKLTQPPLQTDWRQLFLQRVGIDLEAAIVFQDMISSQTKRMSRMNEIAKKRHDVQDLLRNLRDRTPDQAEDVLARRWYADAILRMIHRSGAVDVWRRLSVAHDVSTEEALCAFDMFVLAECRGDFAAVERRFDSIAQSIRDSTAGFEDKTVRQKALLIAEYLFSEGLVGISAIAPDAANYHELRNNFISLALFSTTHTSLPLQSVAIYCAVARRCGVIATPSNFPRHVHAVVEAPPDQTLDGQPKTTETRPEFMHIDVWQAPHQLPEHLLRRRLLQTNIPAEEHDRQLGPSDGVNTLVRASRNILVSVNNARLHYEGGDTPLDEQSYAPDPTAAQYAAFWAMCLLLDENEALAVQRRQFLQVLLQTFLKQFPEDFALIQNRALPMLEGSLDYGRMEDLIEELVATDSDPIEPKIRAAEIGEIQYRVGQHFEHRRYGYKGFIVGWDGRCEADSEWMEMMQIDNLRRGQLQPFYNIVAQDKSQRYVAEENIEILRERPEERLLQLAGRYFKRWDDTENKFVSIIQEQYPDD